MSKVEKKLPAVTKSLTVTDPAILNVIEMINKGKYVEAQKWVQNKGKEEEQVVSRTDIFDAYPADGAVAFTEVLKDVYGWIEQRPIPATFFSPEKPPRMLVVETGPGTRTEVPWGEVKVPNIDGSLFLGAVNEKGIWKFSLRGDVKKKHVEALKALCEKTREYLKDGSIYKGHALRLEWTEEEATDFTAGESGFDTPIFMQPSGMTKEDLVLPSVIYEEVNATIFSLIENAERARRMGVPTKRLVLAAGPYGTGKTLTATVTAELCEKHGRTFIYLREVEHLADAIYFAQQYAPACVFAEDIDRVKDVDLIDKISNTIDGIDTKSLDVLFILTTNHVKEIPQKFLRSGRSDMIIQYTPPDAKAAATLIVKYAGNTLDDSFTSKDALEIGARLAKAEMIPASIREVVERSKLFALAYDRSTITRVDLERASHGVLAQCDLLTEKRDTGLPAHFTEVGIMVQDNRRHMLAEKN